PAPTDAARTPRSSGWPEGRSARSRAAQHDGRQGGMTMTRERTNHYDDGEELGESNATAIIAAVERLVQPTEIQLEDDEPGRPRVIALPQCLELKSLTPFEDERRERPERRSGTAHHTTLASFCAAVARFSDPHSAIFADDNP